MHPDPYDQVHHTYADKDQDMTMGKVTFGNDSPEFQKYMEGLVKKDADKARPLMGYPEGISRRGAIMTLKRDPSDTTKVTDFIDAAGASCQPKEDAGATPVEQSALNTQVGGGHYKDMKIQPMEYSMANNLNACQHTAIKYISRYKNKNGVDDLKKAIHTLQMLIEIEEKRNV